MDDENEEYAQRANHNRFAWFLPIQHSVDARLVMSARKQSEKIRWFIFMGVRRNGSQFVVFRTRSVVYKGKVAGTKYVVKNQFHCLVEQKH